MNKFRCSSLLIILSIVSCRNNNTMNKPIDYYFAEASNSINKLILGEFPLDEDRIGYNNAIVFYEIVSSIPLKSGAINHYHSDDKLIEESLIAWEIWYKENKHLLSEKVITEKYTNHIKVNQEKFPEDKTSLPNNWRDLFKGQNVGFSDEIKGVIILDSLPKGF